METDDWILALIFAVYRNDWSGCISFDVLVSKLRRLWHHPQSIVAAPAEGKLNDWEMDPICDDRLFTAMYMFIMSCMKSNNVCTFVTNSAVGFYTFIIIVAYDEQNHNKWFINCWAISKEKCSVMLCFLCHFILQYLYRLSHHSPMDLPV